MSVCKCRCAIPCLATFNIQTNVHGYSKMRESFAISMDIRLNRCAIPYIIHVQLRESFAISMDIRLSCK